MTLWTMIFPADVVKSRLQVSGATTPMLTVMADILKKEDLARWGVRTNLMIHLDLIFHGFHCSGVQIANDDHMYICNF